MIDTENLIWKDIPGFEGLYKVNNNGVVVKYDTEYFSGCKASVNRIRKSFTVKQFNTNGYNRLPLCVEGRQRLYLTHRLIALAFIPNPENKGYVNHINGIKTDNRVENLEWCTSSENQQHAWDAGLRTMTEKMINCRPIRCLNNDMVFQSITAASKYLNISAGSICQVCKGQRKTVKNYVFKYE